MTKKVIFKFDREEDYQEVYDQIMDGHEEEKSATITETKKQILVHVHTFDEEEELEGEGIFQ